MTDQPIKRKKITIIRRDQLSPAKLATTKKPPPKPRKKPKSVAPKTPSTSPSDLRMENLQASLCGYDIWRNWQPLAIGIEKEVFRHVTKNSLSCSKRVVKRLLHQHTHDRRYLLAIQIGIHRYSLDGSEAGTITQIEK